MDNLLIPDWGGGHAAGVPPGVRALATTRLSLQGCSAAPYEHFNLALHVGDDPLAVAANRASLRRLLPAEPLWLNQVHGTGVVCADTDGGCNDAATVPTADASYAREPGRVCVVLTADCLPLLLAARDGSVVAAAHAGWRGLAAGVIEATVAAMGVPVADLQVWLGPAIGPAAFEVGDEVRAAFCRHDPQAMRAFRAQGRLDQQDKPGQPDKWLCDLYLLARQRLAALGVRQVSGGGLCTWSDERRFYSYRRAGATGRMASLIWRE